MNTPKAERMATVTRLDAERIEYEHAYHEALAAEKREQHQRHDAMRDILKRVRFARNAMQDGCLDLAVEILGEILRAHGEEQP